MNREPAVAGTFYPADPQILRRMVEAMLHQAADATQLPPKAIIVPHAGYQYSGPIAASAYSRLAKVSDKIKRVVLLGPSHRVAFSGLALSLAEHFLTPLGAVSLDHHADSQLDDLPFVGHLEQAHALEHSLEVHLPFLQTTLSQFSLVPIVVGEAGPHQVAEVLNRLWGGEETLLVISSDLSHYHDYQTARRIDQQTSDLIVNLHYETLTAEHACGQAPISGLLHLLRERGLRIQAIDVRNSGDTAGDRRRVVGYGAYVVA